MDADVIRRPENQRKYIMVFLAYLTLLFPSPPFAYLVCAHTSAAAPEQHLAYDW